jgi:hypothetical protein
MKSSPSPDYIYGRQRTSANRALVEILGLILVRTLERLSDNRLSFVLAYAMHILTSKFFIGVGLNCLSNTGTPMGGLRVVFYYIGSMLP